MSHSKKTERGVTEICHQIVYACWGMNSRPNSLWNDVLFWGLFSS